MIRNERQYRITKSQAARLERTLDGLQQRQDNPAGVHPRIAEAQEDAVRSQLTDLEAEVQEYEALKAGHFRMERLDVVEDLAALLVMARIAQGMTQKELAERLGLKEQQIQRYESTDYGSASLSRIKAVAAALAS